MVDDSGEWETVPKERAKCRHCGSNEVRYRLVQDDQGHEDANYQCQVCKKSWWIDGPDY